MKRNSDTHTTACSSEQIYFTEDGKTCSWIIDRSSCRVQSANPKIVARIKSWSFAVLNAIWLFEATTVFSIPRRKWKWVLRQLGIQGSPKSPSRIAHGRKIGKVNAQRWAVSHSQNEKSAIRTELIEHDNVEVNL